MEKELEQWNDEIAKCRNTFHVLNLFTIQQLRVIRQKLGQLNCEMISSLPSAVISMLMSISPKIRGKNIKECLLSIKKCKTSPEDLKKPEEYIEAAIEKLVMQRIDQLSDVEKAAYEKLEGIYPSLLAYLGIINCTDVSMQLEGLIEKVSEWCLKNKSSYEKLVFNKIQALNSQNNESTENEQNEDYEIVASSIVESMQENSVNLMQQVLSENEVAFGLSHGAVEHYPDDTEEALSCCRIEKNKSTEQSFHDSRYV